MNKNVQKSIKSEKGFTMVELIIVIAIMGILSAVLVPTFTSMTRKTRLKADISTVQQVQAQIELYVVEHDGLYPGGADDKEYPAGRLPVKVGPELAGKKYIKLGDVATVAGTNVEIGDIKLQTKGAQISYDTTKEHVVLDVNAAVDSKVKTAVTAGQDPEWAVAVTPE